MKRSKIIFRASVDYDGDCDFDISVITPHVKAHINFYSDENFFATFGEKLMAFPKSAAEVVSFQVGEIKIKPDASYGDYLLFEVYCASPFGHTAIRVIIDNNASQVAHHRFEFSIPSEAASINKLGALLANWQVKNTPEIIWKAETR